MRVTRAKPSHAEKVELTPQLLNPLLLCNKTLSVGTCDTHLAVLGLTEHQTHLGVRSID